MKTYEVSAVLFDLDGTLVDSAEDLRAALNDVLWRLSLRAIEPSEIVAMIGDGVPKLIERGLAAAGGDPTQAPALLGDFLRLYEANPAQRTRCYPTVRETLTELRRRHCRLAVVTNKPAVVTHKVLRDVGLSDLVEVVIGGDTLPQRKPHPAPLREAARQLALDIADLVMVGDNIHDIEAAHAAGILSIAVTYGYHHRPPSTFGADCLVDRLDQLLSLIRVSTPQSEADRPSISLSSHPACSAPESLQ